MEKDLVLDRERDSYWIFDEALDRVCKAVLNQHPDLSSNADGDSMAAAAFKIPITWVGIFIPHGGTASAISTFT